MADADLEEIRRARMAQLQAQGGGGGGGSGSGPSGDDGGEDRQRAEAEARASILAQILEPEAADRLGRIRMVKESRATDVENRLIMLARSGQLRARVTETQLKEILEALTESQQKAAGGGAGGSGGGAGVVINRRVGWDDDDLDDL